MCQLCCKFLGQEVCICPNDWYGLSSIFFLHSHLFEAGRTLRQVIQTECKQKIKIRAFNEGRKQLREVEGSWCPIWQQESA